MADVGGEQAPHAARTMSSFADREASAEREAARAALRVKAALGEVEAWTHTQFAAMHGDAPRASELRSMAAFLSDAADIAVPSHLLTRGAEGDAAVGGTIAAATMRWPRFHGAPVFQHRRETSRWLDSIAGLDEDGDSDDGGDADLVDEDDVVLEDDEDGEETKEKAKLDAAASGLATARRLLLRRNERRTFLKKQKLSRRRDCIAREVMETERSYLDSLLKVRSNIIEPLQWNAEHSGSPILKTEDLSIIFGNIGSIINFSEQLLASLEERLKVWSPSTKLGDIFLFYAPYLPLYTEYVNNYEAALEHTREVEAKPLWPKYWEQFKRLPDVQFAELSSFLIMPVQRIPRYILLFRELKKYTWEDHRDYDDICKSLTLLQTIGDGVNAKMKLDEKSDMMARAQEWFGAFVNVVEPHRRFLLQGELGIVMADEEQQLTAFLFNDMIILADKEADYMGGREAYSFNRKIELAHNSVVEDLEDREFLLNAFRVLSFNSVATLYAPCASDRANWISSLETCIQEQLQLSKRRSAAVTSAPVSWFFGAVPAATARQLIRVRVADVVTRSRGRKKHTVYVFEICRGKRKRTIKKRFSEFHKLHKALSRTTDKEVLPPFPRKHFRALRRQTVENRRVVLLEYLQQLLLLPDMLNEEVVITFCGLDAEFMQVEEESDSQVVRIHLQGGEFRSLTINVDQTSADVVTAVLDKLSTMYSDEPIPPSMYRNFALFLVEDSEERALSIDELPLWELRNHPRGKLQLRRVLYLRGDAEEHPCVRRLTFLQSLSYVRAGLMSVAFAPLIRLSALAATVLYGSYHASHARMLEDAASLYALLPSADGMLHPELRKKRSLPRSQWSEWITLAWSKLEGMSPQEATELYVSMLSRLNYYGCVLAIAKPKRARLSHRRIVIAVGRRGLMLMSVGLMELVENFPFSRLAGWTARDERLTVESKDASVGSLRFDTEHAGTIVDALDRYYEYFLSTGARSVSSLE